jgi:Uma2 family endonuclease
MASLPTTRRVTYEEWLEMPIVEEGREEVIDGEIILMPPNRSGHAWILQNIAADFLRQIDLREVAVLWGFGLVIRKSPLSTRDPDLAVFRRATMIEHDGYYHSAPQLIVEVRSPANRLRNRERLIADYSSLGVPEMWDVIPDTRTIEVLLLQDGQLHRSSTITEGFLKPTCFPTVQIDIAKIWPD